MRLRFGCAAGPRGYGIQTSAVADDRFVHVLKHLGRIAERLIAGGRAPSKPVAIVSKATTGDQRVVVTNLADAAAAAQNAAIEAPTIIAVGEIVRLCAELDRLSLPGLVEHITG